MKKTGDLNKMRDPDNRPRTPTRRARGRRIEIFSAVPLAPDKDRRAIRITIKKCRDRGCRSDRAVCGESVGQRRRFLCLTVSSSERNVNLLRGGRNGPTGRPGVAAQRRATGRAAGVEIAHFRCFFFFL